MSTIAVIGFGILAWVLLAIALALFVARMIKLRDRQRPDPTEAGAAAEGKSGDDAESFWLPPGGQPRNKN